MLTEFKPDIRSLTLIPGTGGVFEVSVEGKKVYSKIETGQFPEPEKIVELVRSTL